MIRDAFKNPSVLVMVVIVALLVGYGVMTMRDQRSLGDKISDAYDHLPQGTDKAERQLEDRTPGQKLGDHVIDLGHDIKKNTQPSDEQ